MKFKMTKREMLQFNDDCNAAANECPQYRNHWVIDDRDILLSDVKPKQLVKHWLECDTLWHYGYAECLSDDACGIIKRYKEWKVLKQAEKIMKKRNEALSDMEKPGTMARTYSSLASQIESIENDKTNGGR